MRWLFTFIFNAAAADEQLLNKWWPKLKIIIEKFFLNNYN